MDNLLGLLDRVRWRPLEIGVLESSVMYAMVLCETTGGQCVISVEKGAVSCGKTERHYANHAFLRFVTVEKESENSVEDRWFSSVLDTMSPELGLGSFFRLNGRMWITDGAKHHHHHHFRCAGRSSPASSVTTTDVEYFPILDFKEFYERYKYLSSDIERWYEHIFEEALHQSVWEEVRLHSSFFEKVVAVLTAEEDLLQLLEEAIKVGQDIIVTVMTYVRSSQKELELMNEPLPEMASSHNRYQQILQRNEARGRMIRQIDQYRQVEKHAVDIFLELCRRQRHHHYWLLRIGGVCRSMISRQQAKMDECVNAFMQQN